MIFMKICPTTINRDFPTSSLFAENILFPHFNSFRSFSSNSQPVHNIHSLKPRLNSFSDFQRGTILFKGIRKLLRKAASRSRFSDVISAFEIDLEIVFVSVRAVFD